MDKTELKDLIIKELKDSGPYCCYCCQPKGGVGCCGENHFVSFGDLYPEDREAMVQEQLYEFEEALK